MFAQKDETQKIMMTVEGVEAVAVVGTYSYPSRQFEALNVTLIGTKNTYEDLMLACEAVALIGSGWILNVVNKDEYDRFYAVLVKEQ